MGVKSKAKVFPNSYTMKPGMNAAQRKADAFSWEVPVEMLTKGKSIELDEFAGPQVGNGYSGDALGEDRAHITYKNGGK